VGRAQAWHADRTGPRAGCPDPAAPTRTTPSDRLAEGPTPIPRSSGKRQTATRRDLRSRRSCTGSSASSSRPSWPTRDRETSQPPRFVEQEFRAYLRCGVAHGFLRVHCDECRFDRLVPFSCKRRGFCPSCGGQRMADTAAHLVDCVLPEVPVRQWVLTLPYALRYRCAYDSRLTSEVLRVFLRALFAELRRRARREWSILAATAAPSPSSSASAPP
jgi:hypothetical protein